MLAEPLVRNAAEEAVQQLIGRRVRPADRLVSSGIIDSLSVLKLIGLIETRLSISIPTGTVQPEDFDNIDLIVETVRRVSEPS